MSMVQRYVFTRAFRISALILLLFSIICTRIPLFNYLGFEFSVAVVLVAGYLAGILTLAHWRKSSPQSKSDVWQFIGSIAAVLLILVSFPFLISLANVLFVKNCSLGEGVTLYALIVLPGVFFSVSAAFLIGVSFAKWHKTLFTLIYFFILCHIPIVTLLRPQIFAFNPILGFFPGFTYDETLMVTQRLLTYRLATCAAAGSLTAGAVWLWQFRKNRDKASGTVRHSLPILELSILALLTPAVIIVFTLSDRLGFSSSEEFIRHKLAGNYKTAHFDIVYSAGSVKRERIEQMGRLHEFYFDELTRELKIQSPGHIAIFIYASPEQKEKFIGAARTNIAKPWLRQLHMNLSDAEAVLRHELVHVLASEFGWSPLKIAPNSGLIEGLAEAMERTAYEEPLDRAAALTYAAGLRPDIESLFTMTGFATANSGVAYTIAGAFCRSLIDTFGIERFKQVYGGARFKDVYDANLSTLIGTWQKSIRQLPLEFVDSVKAAYYFHRPSIFGKTCARVLANLHNETRQSILHHDFEKALASADRSLSLSRTPEAIIQKASVLFELRKFSEVIAFVTQQLQDTTIGDALLPFHVRLADSYWAMDSLEQAKRSYAAMTRIHLAARYDEACLLRLGAIRDAREQEELKIYFTYSLEDTIRISRLEQLRSPVARYLLASEYAAKERFAESAQLLDRLGLMESRTLEFFRLQRLGKIFFELQEYNKAKDAFIQSLHFVSRRYFQIETEEWIRRCEFFAESISQ